MRWLRPSWWSGTRPAGRAQYLLAFITIWILFYMMLLVCPTDCFGKALSLIWPCVDTVVVCFRLDFAMPGFLSGVSTFTAQWIYSLCTVRCQMGKSSFCAETAAEFLGSLWGWILHWAVTASVTHYYSGLLPSLEALPFPLLVWGMVRSTVWV